MLELAEEPLDEVAVAVKPRAEGWHVYVWRERLDVGPGAAAGHHGPQGIIVIGTVGDQDLAVADGVQHVGRAASVMCLSLGQLQRNGIPVGIDHSMDLGGQPAPRAPHASGWSKVPSVGWRRAPF
jgi:hypothetical protein